VNVLVMILYTHPTKNLGVNSFKLRGFSFFDIRIIKDAYTPVCWEMGF